MTMGDRIRYLREKNGMTLEELGDLIGVQKSAVLKYEKGSVENIKSSAIKVMADRFGVTPCYLMWGAEGEDESLPPIQHAPEIEELIRLFSDLPKDVQDRVLALMRDLSKAHTKSTDLPQTDS